MPPTVVICKKPFSSNHSSCSYFAAATAIRHKIKTTKFCSYCNNHVPQGESAVHTWVIDLVLIRSPFSVATYGIIVTLMADLYHLSPPISLHRSLATLFIDSTNVYYIFNHVVSMYLSMIDFHLPVDETFMFIRRRASDERISMGRIRHEYSRPIPHAEIGKNTAEQIFGCEDSCSRHCSAVYCIIV